jgi:hypothetical protein
MDGLLIMRFRDIPQLTRSANYQVHVFWDYLETTLEHYNEFGTLELDPPFQRAHVWDEEKQRRYVEYVLKGGKSSRDIYFNCADWMKGYKAPIYLVDGKQRLEAVRKFLRNELGIFLLPYSAPLGHFYSDFEDKIPFEANFIFHVNDLATYREVLQFYYDLNAGGVAHTEEELDKVRKMIAEEEKRDRSN